MPPRKQVSNGPPPHLLLQNEIPSMKKAHVNRVKLIVCFHESNLKQPETIFSVMHIF